MSSRARFKLKLSTLIGKGSRCAAPPTDGRNAGGQRENFVGTSSEIVPPLVRRSSAPSSLKLINRMNSETSTETSAHEKHGGRRGQVKKRHRRSKSMNDLSSTSAGRSNNRVLDSSSRDNESASLVDGERNRQRGVIRGRHPLKHISESIRRRRVPSASSRNMNNAQVDGSNGGHLLSSPTLDCDSYRTCEAVACERSISNNTLASAPEVGEDATEPERGSAPEHLERETAGHDSLRQNGVGAREVGHMPGMVQSFELIYGNLQRAEAAKQIVNLINTLEESQSSLLMYTVFQKRR